MYPLNVNETTLINKVREDYFSDYDCNDNFNHLDFAVAIRKDGKELYTETEYVLWAEAKQGCKHNIYESFIQLILTIGKERTHEHVNAPLFLGAFDAEKIAFIPFEAISDVLYQHDFNWNVTPSDHSTKEFQQLKELVRKYLNASEKEKESIFVFYFDNHQKELRRFIKQNLVGGGKKSVHRMPINHSNFTRVYAKWVKEVQPSIKINWKKAKEVGLLDSHFFLADLMAGDDNKTLMQKLFVLLNGDHYDVGNKKDDMGLDLSAKAYFKDGMVAHKIFWNRYQRPPHKIYWDEIIKRQDLLVPQDIRRTKGSYYTPDIWVNKSQEYLENLLGENWQKEYYIWDCCAGTGNLLANLTEPYRIWASELYDSNVKIMHERIEKMGDGSNLLKDHVFQFDFLNDSFDKLPYSLKEVIYNEEKRKKLIIYINPPYAEAGTATQVTGGEGNKTGVSNTSEVWKANKDKFGLGIRELYVQFFVRIYQEIPGATLAEFSKLKILQGSAFADFREFFLAKLRSLFIVPAKTFDNVKGSFPIGFFIWDTSQKEKFEEIIADVYEADGEPAGHKKITVDGNDLAITKWISDFDVKDTHNVIGYTGNNGPDYQNNQYLQICSIQKKFANGTLNNATKYSITAKNLIPISIYFGARLCIPASWLNDRDQFLCPNDGWKYDKAFQSDCLAFALFHGQNRITSEHGINHWIPFTAEELKAPDLFKSSFMADFIAGRCKLPNVTTLFERAEESYIPQDPIVFTPAAQKVMDIGRKIWYHYLHHKDGSNELYGADIDINASFYDIRAYFQGRDEKGKMNNESADQTYMSLLKDLRAAQKVLAKQIEKKVYLYGFLKGEVEVDPSERLHELERQNAELRHQLQQQQSQQVNVHIDHVDTLHLGDNVDHKYE